MIEIEKDIIDQCRRKERKAQMRLYTALSRRIYNSCYRILNNSYEAEDAMQDSCLKVFSSLDSYDDNISFLAWVTRIAINTSIDKLRAKNLETIRFNEDLNVDIKDEDDSEVWNATLAKVETVKKAINELSEANRLVITLYLIEGYDHEEIAEILHLKAGTVRIQYMRAKQKLLELLKAG